MKDATTGASWGLLRWEGAQPAGSTVAFATRSGNTSTPDETWADWVPVRDEEGVQRIASPPARYLQWKVDLAGAPVLDHVTLTYLPRNQRPRLTSLTVHPPGVVFQQPYATQEPPDLAGYLSTTPAPARDQAIAAATPTATAAPVGRRLYQKGFQTFQWEATDPDKDDLRYEVAVRRVGADDWRVLARELVGTVYAWDTSLLPDGRYVVRVDRRGQPRQSGRDRPAGRARERAADNRQHAAHRAGQRQAGSGAASSSLAFEVTDAASTLDRVDVLLGNGQWRPVFPVDGALDGLRERFSVPLATLGDGPVVLRATDSLGNLATLEVRPQKAAPRK